MLRGESACVNSRKPGKGTGLFPGWLALCLLLFILAGCFNQGIEVIQEEEETSFRRGQQYLREDRPDEALAAFLRVIEKRRDAPESHLHAGELYLEHIEDPIAAIYHYRKFLEIRPEGPESGNVEQRIETARKELLRQFPLQPYDSQLDRLDLLDRLERSRDEINGLKRQIATLQTENRRLEQNLRAAQNQAIVMDPAPETSPRPQRPEPEPVVSTPAERPASYVVQAGDTLSSISRTVYGTSGRWMDIYQANRDLLPSPNALRVGQELRLP